MSEPKTRQATGDGITMQLAEWPGAEKTILCIHGLSSNCRWWDIIATVLAPEYHVLAMDLRGRGLSDKPATGYSLAHHCRDIQALLGNLSLEDVTAFYPKLCCPVLILRATEGMFAADDLLLPQDVVQRMLQDIPQAHCVNVPGCNHYTIVFRDSERRDQALRDFLAT